MLPAVSIQWLILLKVPLTFLHLTSSFLSEQCTGQPESFSSTHRILFSFFMLPCSPVTDTLTIEQHVYRSYVLHG